MEQMIRAIGSALSLTGLVLMGSHNQLPTPIPFLSIVGIGLFVSGMIVFDIGEMVDTKNTTKRVLVGVMSGLVAASVIALYATGSMIAMIAVAFCFIGLGVVLGMDEENGIRSDVYKPVLGVVSIILGLFSLFNIQRPSCIVDGPGGILLGTGFSLLT